MQHEIEDRLSEKILHGELNPGDHVKVDADGGQFLFETGPRGEKVAVGVNTNGGAITATPDLAAASGE
jgi:ATP-dependent Clp protease ATP-binding subunit ClpC